MAKILPFIHHSWPIVVPVLSYPASSKGSSLCFKRIMNFEDVSALVLGFAMPLLMTGPAILQRISPNWIAIICTPYVHSMLLYFS
jgi:hypothetical protein